MRIVSYNIRLALDSSLERIAEVLEGLAPDVVCLQEVGCGWGMGEPVAMAAVLARLTGARWSVFAPALQEGAGQYGIAVLSRRPLRVLERVPLPRKVDEARVLLGLRVEAGGGEAGRGDDEAGPSWLLVTSHVSVRAEDRPGQLEALTRWVLTLRARERLPLVVAGDLNAELDEPALREAMSWTKLRSAHVLSSGSAPKSFPVRGPTDAIDHVLVTPEWQVVGAGVAEVPGSDHFPVWADIEIAR
jgi:endonuclease/exonuclease/phosphatase family metal-dependent hydrolase